MEPIKIDITILEPIEKVWSYYNDPRHIVKWNFATDKWCCPKAENNLTVGGTFNYRMEAKDKSYGFDMTGTYEEIIPNQQITYRLDDGRKVMVTFEKVDDSTTKVIQEFEPESFNSREMQREGWYQILNNFHKYVETH